MTTTRILVVDDDATLLQAIHGTFALRLREVMVDTCESVTRVVERIKARDYGAIICDMNMPVMNGLELLREMKKVRPWTPLLLMTGNASEDYEALMPSLPMNVHMATHVDAAVSIVQLPSVLVALIRGEVTP